MSRSLRIVVIGPAGRNLSAENTARACAWLRSAGHRVEIATPDEGWQRFADTDDGRLAQIHAAAARRDVDVVMILRGGYGVTRLLERIDWRVIAGSVESGVYWVGYSDFTAFQAALLTKTGAVSYAGPAFVDDFGRENRDAGTVDAFFAAVDGRLPEIDWQDSPGMPLSARGTLWGGNLATIAHLVGSDYLPVLPDRSALLFVEDVGEHPYRIERMFHQLWRAGVLARQAALILGQFNDWRAAAHDHGYGLDTVIEYWRDRLDVPIVSGLPFGHVPSKPMLEIGGTYSLTREATGACRLRSVRGSPTLGPAGQIRPSSIA